MRTLLKFIGDENLAPKELSQEDKNSIKMLSGYAALKYVLEKRILDSTLGYSSGWEQIQIKADVNVYENEILHSMGSTIYFAKNILDSY